MVNVGEHRTVVLKNLRITRGVEESPNGEPGGIRNYGNLTMSTCTVTANSAATAGGIRNSGKLTMTGCTVSHNEASETAVGGGGIYTEGSELSLSGCDVDHNTASGDGGGIFVTTGNVTLDEDCQVTGNTARSGGGIFNLTGNVTLQGTTPGNIVTANCPDNCAGSTAVAHCAAGGSCP
jgi:hypothetical protein